MSVLLKKIIYFSLTAPILVFLVWYVVYFFPHLSAIKNIQREGMSLVKVIESTLYPIAIIADGNMKIRSYSIKTAYYTESLKGEKEKIANWHLSTSLWFLASYMHFNDKEIFYLWVMYAPYEKGRGLQNSSEYYYGKKINELSIEEQITILAIPKAPTLYKLDSEKLKTRVKNIFKELRER